MLLPTRRAGTSGPFSAGSAPRPRRQPHGKAQTFKAGQSFFAPQGAVFSWTSTEYVRKYYVIFHPKVAAAVADAAE